MNDLPELSRKSKQGQHPKETTKHQRIQAYKHWLADPCSKGSKGDFAKTLGLTSERVFCDYEKEEGFWLEVWSLYTDHYLQGQLPAVNRKVVAKAKAGDRWAVELVLQQAGKLSKRIGEPPEPPKIPKKYVLVTREECSNNLNKKKSE